MGVLEDAKPHLALQEPLLPGGAGPAVQRQVGHYFVLPFFFSENMASRVPSQAVGLRFAAAPVQHHGS